MDATLAEDITELIELGIHLKQHGRIDEALAVWEEAFTQLPVLTEHPQGLWLAIALGEQHYLRRHFAEAHTYFYAAWQAMPEEDDRLAKLLARLAECLHELGDTDGALEFLMRATMERSDMQERVNEAFEGMSILSMPRGGKLN